jgi:three-Cys-motif partner protein
MESDGQPSRELELERPNSYGGLGLATHLKRGQGWNVIYGSLTAWLAAFKTQAKWPTEGFGTMALNRVHKPKPPKLHQDETRIVELHLQTLHKLEVIRRYYGQYASIIAQAGKAKKLDASHIYIVDAMSGAGAHLSSEDPDNEVPGTAVQACIEARNVQRSFPETHVHVRLIDLEAGFTERLEPRIAEYRDAASFPERVDVTVEAVDFATRIGPILAETRRGPRHYCSLWFLDPFAFEVPHTALEDLSRVRQGVEIIVNLNVGAVQRCIRAAQSPNTDPIDAQKDREHLNVLFGAVESWENILSEPRSGREELNAIAAAYAATLPRFHFTACHRLNGSDSQVRYLIQFTNAKRAVAALTASYRASLQTGTLKGKKLSMSDRGKAVAKLWGAFKGTEITIDYLAKQTLCRLDRNQAKVVARHAHDKGLAKYDKATGTVRWNEKCEKDNMLPLDLSQHRERSRRPRDERQTELFSS